MSKAIKIGLVVMALAALAFVAIVAGGTYFARQYMAGLGWERQGYDAVVRGDNDEAIKSLGEALAMPIPNSQRALVYLNRGTAYSRKRRYDEAIRDFGSALQLNSNLADAYAERGWAYQEKHDFENAIVDLSEAIRRDPNSHWAHYNLGGILLREKHDPRHALAEFDEAVRCAPESSNALVMRASCYSELKDDERALASLDGAIMLNPHDAFAFKERSAIYARRGEADKSSRDASDARRLMPPTASLTSSPHRSSSALERDAKMFLKPLPKTEISDQHRIGDTFDELMQGGDEAYAAGNFDKAMENYNHALARDITNVQASIAVLRRGNLHFAKRENELAYADFEEAIRLNPRNASAYDNRGWMLQRQGDRAGAEKDFQESIRLDPRNARAYCNRASLFCEEGELERGAADYTKAIEVQPNDSSGHLGMAGVYLARNEGENALTECKRALELDPHSRVAHLDRARAHARLRQRSAALDELEAAKESTPNESATALNSVAWLRATAPESESALRDGRRAVAEAAKVCEMTHGKDWRYLDTLAAACAEAGDFTRAIRTETDALALAGDDPETIAAKQRLALYQQRKPFRENPYHTPTNRQ